MDETTEPIIAVIGHPIAGNPTQFALEIGLQAAGVDCRVLSIDVQDDRIRDAIIGMNAMNFAGIWIADNSRDAVERWLSETDRGGRWVDFLKTCPPSDDPAARPESFWEPIVLKSHVWPRLVDESLASAGARFGRVLLVDESLAISEEFPTVESDHDQSKYWMDWFRASGVKSLAALTEDQIRFQRSVPTSEELITQEEELSDGESILVVLSDADRDHCQAIDQLSLPPRTVMVDLNESLDPTILASADRLKASSAGSLVRGIDVHAKCLAEIILRLFDRQVSLETLQEAIDEYLAV